MNVMSKLKALKYLQYALCWTLEQTNLWKWDWHLLAKDETNSGGGYRLRKSWICTASHRSPNYILAHAIHANKI